MSNECTDAKEDAYQFAFLQIIFAESFCFAKKEKRKI